MPVDRVRRDAAADALASFLRRETGRGELADALHLLLSAQNSEEKSKSVHDAYLEEDFIECWLQWERHEPITEQKWLALCRTLASLKTDFEEKPLPRHGGEDGPGQILLARWHTLGLLISLGLSYLISWWVFAAATVLSFLLYQASLYKHDFMADKQREREIKRRMEHYPFEDEAEWLAYKQYLDAFVLPDYENCLCRPNSTKKMALVLGRSRSSRWLPDYWSQCIIHVRILCCLLASVVSDDVTLPKGTRSTKTSKLLRVVPAQSLGRRPETQREMSQSYRTFGEGKSRVAAISLSWALSQPQCRATSTRGVREPQGAIVRELTHLVY